jgi:Protein of unknown function (DUF3046)
MHSARHGRPRYAGALVGRRTTKITRCALLPLLSHVFNNDTSGKKISWPSRRGSVGEPGSVRRAGAVPGASTLGQVRQTEFWDRMRAQFGEVYAQSVAKDYVFDNLGARTVERALADGVDAKVVWRAVCDTFKVPENLR